MKGLSKFFHLDLLNIVLIKLVTHNRLDRNWLEWITLSWLHLNIRRVQLSSYQAHISKTIYYSVYPHNDIINSIIISMQSNI